MAQIFNEEIKLVTYENNVFVEKYGQLTILQLALYNRCFKLFNYMLKDYSKKLDPRILLVNNAQPADTTLTLRLAVEIGNHNLMLELLEDYGYLYAQNDVVILSKYLISKINHDFSDYHAFLQHRTTQ